MLVGLGCLGSDAVSLYELDTPALTEKAEAGDAEAQYWLGSRYYSGRDGVQQDYSQTMDWLQKSVDQGNARAQSLLGHMYVTACGVAPDFEKGLELVHAAAAQANSTALNYLGNFYEMGRAGLTPDRFEAMDWYIKAVAKRHSSAKKSLSKLRKEADAFRMGTASNEWWEISLEELTELAETGDAEAQRNLGVRYKGYGGIPVDFEKAQYWLEQSAAQTNLSAHYGLALLYTSTTNVQSEKAFHHCSVAAEGDYRSAQNTLGRYFRDGVGTAPDRVKALRWYRKAEQAGHSSAPENIYNLMKGQLIDHSSVKNGISIASKKYVLPAVKFSIRDFDNQKTEVRFVEYDVKEKTVKIEPALGSVNTLPLSAFSKKSHPAILQEAVYDAFEELSVRIKRKNLSRKECEQEGKVFGKKGSSEFEYDGFVYSLSFKNRGGVRLNNLNVECEFFYGTKEQISSLFGEGSWHEKSGVEDCMLKKISIDAGQKSVAQTPPFILESYHTDSDVYYQDGSPTTVESDPVGLMVRVSCPMMDGSDVYRDFYEKSSLSSKVSWKERMTNASRTEKKK